MKKIKILFGFKHTDKPLSGGNSFIKALHSKLSHLKEFEIVDSFNSPFDILFMNQLDLGPSHPDSPKINFYKINFIKDQLAKNQNIKLVVRAVNFRIFTNFNSFLDYRKVMNFIIFNRIDNNNRKLFNLADYLIFQSNYQKDYMLKSLPKINNYKVIHNGANNVFAGINDKNIKSNDRIQIVTSIGNNLKIKQNDLIAKLSLLSNIEIHYFGLWPQNLPSNKIILHGMTTHDEMREFYRNAHFYYHPGYKEACSNSILEAMYSGLPVLYNPDIGSNAEIVGDSGFPLDENNMENSLNFAIEKYDSAIDNLHKNSYYYSIDRAVNDYIEVFKAAVRC